MRNEDDFLRAKGIPVDNKEEIFGSVEPVTEEKGDMIDFALVEDEKAKDHIDHEIETVVEASVALEAYAQILKQNSYDGISKQAAQAMRIGIARIDRLIGQRSALVVALEDEAYDKPRIGQEKSEVSEKGLAGRAKELWKKFVELIKKWLEKLKHGLSKIKAGINNGKKRVEKLREDFANWSPNGPNGGKKITIPAKQATLGYPGGKHVDMNEVLGVANWLHTQLNPVILKGYDTMRNLKGTESADQIREAAQVKIPPLPTFPASANVELVDNKIKFEVVSGEEVTVQVRSRSQISKTLDLCSKINDASDKNNEAIDKLFSASMDLIDMDWELRYKGNSEVITVLQEAIGYLRDLVTQHRAMTLYVLHTNVAMFDIMGLERGDRTTEEAASNPIFDE